jgi:hypothetical protein
MKKQWRNYLLLFLPVLSFVLFLSACGIKSTATSSTNNTPVKDNGQNNLTPLQVLQKSERAMKSVKAYHLTLNTTIDTKPVGSPSATSLGTMGATLGSRNLLTIPLGSLHITNTSSGPIDNIHVVTTGSGDIQSTGNEKLNLTANSSHTSEIVVGDRVYIQNAVDQTWYYGDGRGYEGIGIQGFTLDQNSVLVLLQNAKVTDHGTQMLNGQSLRHLTATLDKAELEELFSQNFQLQTSYDNLHALADQAQTSTATIDVWIDKQQFYVHRVELGIDSTKSSQGSSQQPATSPSISLKLDDITNLSNFNETITIAPPANARPFSAAPAEG